MECAAACDLQITLNKMKRNFAGAAYMATSPLTYSRGTGLRCLLLTDNRCFNLFNFSTLNGEIAHHIYNTSNLQYHWQANMNYFRVFFFVKRNKDIIFLTGAVSLAFT